MKFSIKNITPIHIGSGTELQGDFEYLYFPQEQKIAVIDPEKILNILGEENLGQWVACIEKKEPLLPLLQSRKRELTSGEIASRTIRCIIPTNKPIREQLKNGNNTPLLPGSSIKGSIRTALWGTLIRENADMVHDKHNLGVFDYQNRFKWKDEVLSKKFFGNNPNQDIFRLLQVGDASFTHTEVYKTEVVNKFNNSWGIKSELTQFIEAIPSGNSSQLKINFNSLLWERAGSGFNNNNAHELEKYNLLPLINTHTQRLVQDEMDYWLDKADNPEAIGDYVSKLEALVSIIDSCKHNECVLRIGWGTGFRSMTGDWNELLPDEHYFQLIKSLRPKHPTNLIFPKTTRIISGGIPLGFVKLSQMD